MRQTPGVAGVARLAKNVACLDALAYRDVHAIQGEVGVKRYGAVIVIDRDQIRARTIAIDCTVLRMHDDTVSCGGNKGANWHLEVIAKLPETGVAEAGTVSLIDAVRLPDSVRQYESRLLPITETST